MKLYETNYVNARPVVVAGDAPPQACRARSGLTVVLRRPAVPRIRSMCSPRSPATDASS